MSKTAFIFPGQGAQKAGMGADFYENSELAAKIYDEAAEHLGIDMKALCFEKNEKLDVTEYTQAAMVTTCLAMERVLENAGVKPDVTAGLSLGEYTAIAVAGGMTDQDAIRLVRKRGILMQNTVPAGEGAMCAVMALDAQKIENVIADISGVTVANYNCPGQIVITGEKNSVEKAAEKLKEAGAKRTILLNVSGPFHSAMLEEAGEKLADVLEKVTISELQIPYVTNVTAEFVKEHQKIRSLLAKQISSPVKWQQSVEAMIAEGVDTFIEIGPGKTLAGFMRKINRNAKVYNVQTVEDIEKVVQECSRK